MDESQDKADAATQCWTFGDTEFDEARRTLRVNGSVVEIEQRPLDVLGYLLQHAGEVVTKQELMDAAWPGTVVVDNALTNAIGKLRKALGSDGQRIQTAHRVGYKLTGTVKRAPVASAPRAWVFKAGDHVPNREHWVLERALGHGARSEVWLATHAKTGEKRVFKFSLDGSRLPSLKREATIYRMLRSALGGRDDFVRILDWNFSTAPYYLECPYAGADLIEWAERRGGIATVPLAERLRLVEQIARTLDDAHRSGVLHKDLKPANVLVDEQDGRITVRIADFGSGRLLEPGRLAELGVTQMGFTVTRAFDESSDSATAQYLAPEVRSGELPSTASDIFSLGLMLYQLAVGDLSRPMTASWRQDVDDPLLADDIATAAHRDPAQRMRTAAELAKRIRDLPARHEALKAEQRRETERAALEREQARIRSRRPWVWTAAVTLLVGVVISSVLAVQAFRSEARALAQASRAEALNDFLIGDILKATGPAGEQPGDARIRDALLAAGEHVDDRFEGQPQTAAEIHIALSDTFSAIADFAASVRHSDAAVQALETVGGAAAERAIQRRYFAISTLARSGELDQARERLAEADRLFLALTQRTTQTRFDRAQAKGFVEAYAGNYSEAADFLATTVELVDRLPGATVEKTTNTRFNHAGMLMYAGRVEEASEAQRQIVDIYSTELGGRHLRTASALSTYSESLLKLGRYEEAAEVASRSADTFEAQLGGNHVYLGSALYILGNSLVALNRLDQGCEVLDRSLAVKQTTLAVTHTSVLAGISAVANCRVAMGQPEAALPLLQEASAAILDPEPADVLPNGHYLMFQLAIALADAGHVGESLALDERIDAEKLVVASPESHWDANFAVLEGARLASKGEIHEAERVFQHAIELYQTQAEYFAAEIQDVERRRAALGRETASPAS